MIQFLAALQSAGAAAATGLASAQAAVASSGVGQAVSGAASNVAGGATKAMGGLSDIAGGMTNMNLTEMKGGLSDLQGGLTDAKGGLSDLASSADKGASNQLSKLDSSFKDSKFGKSNFAKDTGLDKLLEPSNDPRISAHSQPKPMQSDDGVDRFRAVSSMVNNPSVGAMTSAPTAQAGSIPYTAASVDESAQQAALYDQQTADAVSEVIAADLTLPTAPLVQPTNYEHGSLYSPRNDVISVDDFINNRGR